MEPKCVFDIRALLLNIIRCRQICSLCMSLNYWSLLGTKRDIKYVYLRPVIVTKKGCKDTYLCFPLVSDAYMGPKGTKMDVNC